MRITVQLFARARDLAGAGTVVIDMPEGAQLGDLRRRLADTTPALAGLLERCSLAVDNEFAADDLPLSPGCEVAVLPPVSGGTCEAEPRGQCVPRQSPGTSVNGLR